MSFSELIPAGALDRDTDVVQLAPRRDERVMVCTRCDQPILVGGYVDDLDPGTYVGVACRCRLQARRGHGACLDNPLPCSPANTRSGILHGVKTRQKERTS